MDDDALRAIGSNPKSVARLLNGLSTVATVQQWIDEHPSEAELLRASGEVLPSKPDVKQVIAAIASVEAVGPDAHDLVRAVLDRDPAIAKAVIEHDVRAGDIQSLAYRRAHLERMEKLLNDPEYFESQKAELGLTKDEDVWQQFLNKNQWILGFGLHYVIGEGFDPKKLELVVKGPSIAGAGKRVDALLVTRGVVRSLCYVEIKTHRTPLLAAETYRSEVWRPSVELCGAVAQAQKTAQLALEQLNTIFHVPAGSIHAGKQFFNYAPRSIVVCGMLNDFIDQGVDDMRKYSSFDVYRRNIDSPDIVTFDELYARARAILDSKGIPAEIEEKPIEGQEAQSGLDIEKAFISSPPQGIMGA